MEYEIALIDKAASLCGENYAELSRVWGVPESRISEYRRGKRHIPLAKVPKLAVIAEVDPQEAYLRVSIEQMPEGSEERDLLGKARAAIVAAMLLFFVVPVLLQPSQSYAKDSKEGCNYFICYTSWSLQRDPGTVRHGACHTACCSSKAPPNQLPPNASHPCHFHTHRRRFRARSALRAGPTIPWGP